MIDPLEAFLQPLPIQFASALVVQFSPKLLDAYVALVLRFLHLHLKLGDRLGNVHTQRS